MEKSRKPREESGKSPSRRVFLQRVAEAGLATAAGVALLPSLTEAGKGSTQVPTATGTTTGTNTTGSTSAGTTTTTTTPTATTPVAAAMGSDAGALNFLLTLERLEAAFYNLNINKSYLTSTAPVGATPSTTTGATTGTTGTTTGTTGTTPTSTTSTGTSTGTPTGTTPAVGVPTTTPSGNLAVLLSLVTEISAHENSHVSQLEQILGTNAQAAPTFQNLDMPTLQQFLNLAEMLEDIGVSAYEGQIPLIQDKGILATVDGIQAIEGRHAGGIRTYRKLASTAEGGDPNTKLTEDGQPVNPSRTMAQVQALIAPYIVGGATTPTTTTPTTPTPTATTGTTTGGTTGSNPATPLPATGGSTTGSTTAATTGTTPSY